MANYGGVMSDERKSILKKNHQNIVKNICDVGIILDILFENQIISRDFMESVLSKSTRSDRARELMMNLHRYGDIAYNGLLVALQSTNQTRLAQMIDPNFKGQDEPDNYMEELSNIETYTFEDLEMKSLLPAAVHQVVTDRDNYKVNGEEGKKIGRVVVVNNKYFDCLSEREGSEVDVEFVVKCFEKLKFDVEVHHDKEAMDVLTILKEESNKLNEQVGIPHDIFILFLMSHGAKDYIYGTDGYKDMNMVSIETVQEIFDAENCPGLAKIPKLFFIQACQQLIVSPKNEGIKENIEWRKLKPKPGIPIMKTHKSSDMFIMISTVAGYLSWRHSERGSFFIRTIIYEIATKCHRMDLLSMMTEAQRLLTGIEIQTMTGKFTQQPEIRSTLRKKLYFLP